MLQLSKANYNGGRTSSFDVVLESLLLILKRQAYEIRHSRINLVRLVEDRKNLKRYGLLKMTIPLRIFYKGCLPQTLLGPFLNTLFHIILKILLLSLNCFS